MCRANYGKKIGDESHLATVSAVGGVVAGGILFGPELLAACGVNLAACTELGITAVEVSLGSAAAGGTALSVGGFVSLAAKEVAATADAAAAVRNADAAKEAEEAGKLLADASKLLNEYNGTFGKYKPPTVIGAMDPLAGEIVTASSGAVPDVIAPELAAYAETLGGLGVKAAEKGDRFI